MNKYKAQRGQGWLNNSNIYQGTLTQKGYGLGGLFSKFFKWISPIIKTHALPSIVKGAKVLGKEAFSSANNLFDDVVEGKNVKQAAKTRVNSAINNIKDKVESEFPVPQEGSGINKKKKFIQIADIRKKRNNPIAIIDSFL